MSVRFDQPAFGVLHAPFADFFAVAEFADGRQRAGLATSLVTFFEHAVLQLSIRVILASVNLHRHEYAGTSSGAKAIPLQQSRIGGARLSPKDHGIVTQVEMEDEFHEPVIFFVGCRDKWGLTGWPLV